MLVISILLIKATIAIEIKGSENVMVLRMRYHIGDPTDQFMFILKS